MEHKAPLQQERSERALLTLAKLYSAAVQQFGGRSLSRVATVVVNRGSFFSALERGSTCSLRNFDKMMAYLSAPANWPHGTIPNEAIAALASCGHKASTPLSAAAWLGRTMADPRESITIHELAHGFRIDVVAAHPSGPAQRLAPVHYPTRALAERFAEMLSQATGVPVIERDQPHEEQPWWRADL
jgi:hypothetical protein